MSRCVFRWVNPFWRHRADYQKLREAISGDGRDFAQSLFRRCHWRQFWDCCTAIQLSDQRCEPGTYLAKDFIISPVSLNVMTANLRRSGLCPVPSPNFELIFPSISESLTAFQILQTSVIFVLGDGCITSFPAQSQRRAGAGIKHRVNIILSQTEFQSAWRGKDTVPRFEGIPASKWPPRASKNGLWINTCRRMAARNKLYSTMTIR